MKTTFRCVLYAFAISLPILSCTPSTQPDNKENQESQTAQKRLLALSIDDVIMSISYNNDGRIRDMKSIEKGIAYAVSFEYSQNSIIMTNGHENKEESRYLCKTDNGVVVSLARQNKAEDGTWKDTMSEYEIGWDGSGHISSIIYKYNNKTSSIVRLVWENGNLIEISEESSGSQYKYQLKYSEMDNKVGTLVLPWVSLKEDLLECLLLNLLPTSKLPKSAIGTTSYDRQTTELFEYTLDDDGYPVKLESSSVSLYNDDVSTYSYTETFSYN